MCDGGIIPYETTVHILIKAMQENPSKVSKLFLFIKTDLFYLLFFCSSTLLMDSHVQLTKPNTLSKTLEKSNWSCTLISPLKRWPINLLKDAHKVPELTTPQTSSRREWATMLINACQSTTTTEPLARSEELTVPLTLLRCTSRPRKQSSLRLCSWLDQRHQERLPLESRWPTEQTQSLLTSEVSLKKTNSKEKMMKNRSCVWSTPSIMKSTQEFLSKTSHKTNSKPSSIWETAKLHQMSLCWTALKISVKREWKRLARSTRITSIPVYFPRRLRSITMKPKHSFHTCKSVLIVLKSTVSKAWTRHLMMSTDSLSHRSFISDLELQAMT